jgi:hypothetical protein
MKNVACSSAWMSTKNRSTFRSPKKGYEVRSRARIPAARQFREKWRLALLLVQRARAAKLEIEAVVADAGYGNVVALRTALDRAGLSYLMGITSDTTVFDGVPSVRPGRGRRKPRGPGIVDTAACAVRTLADALPPRAWRWVTWRNGRQRQWRAQFAVVRVVPFALWRLHRRLDPCWLLCERSREHPSGLRFYFSNLPATTPLARLARLAHQRWAIEQQYSDLKTELGLDHFEGRTFPAGSITSCSVRSRTSFCKANGDDGPTSRSRFRRSTRWCKKSSPAFSLCRGPSTSRGSTPDVAIWTTIRSGSDKVVDPRSISLAAEYAKTPTFSAPQPRHFGPEDAECQPCRFESLGFLSIHGSEAERNGCGMTTDSPRLANKAHPADSGLFASRTPQ